MQNEIYIPQNVEDLYNRMITENFIGEISFENEWLTWTLPNGIVIGVAVNNQQHEGYIDTKYFDGQKNITLTHWHPMEDEIYSDLSAINDGEAFWIVKKKSVLKSLPQIIDKSEWQRLDEKSKCKFTIL